MNSEAGFPEPIPPQVSTAPLNIGFNADQRVEPPIPAQAADSAKSSSDARSSGGDRGRKDVQTPQESVGAEDERQKRLKKLRVEALSGVAEADEDDPKADKEGQLLLREIENSLGTQPDRFGELGKLYADLIKYQNNKNNDPAAYLRMYRTIGLIRKVIGVDQEKRPLPQVAVGEDKRLAIDRVEKGLDREVGVISRDIGVYVLDREGYFDSKAEQALVLEDLQRDIIRDEIGPEGGRKKKNSRVEVRKMAYRYREADDATWSIEQRVASKYIDPKGKTQRIKGIEVGPDLDSTISPGYQETPVPMTATDELRKITESRHRSVSEKCDGMLLPEEGTEEYNEKLDGYSKESSDIVDGEIVTIAGELTEIALPKIDTDGIKEELSGFLMGVDLEKERLKLALESCDPGKVAEVYDSLRKLQIQIEATKVEVGINTADVLIGEIVVGKEILPKVKKKKESLSRKRSDLLLKSQRRDSEFLERVNIKFLDFRKRIGEIAGTPFRSLGSFIKEQENTLDPKKVAERDRRKMNVRLVGDNAIIDRQIRREQLKVDAATELRRRLGFLAQEKDPSKYGALRSIFEERMNILRKNLQETAYTSVFSKFADVLLQELTMAEKGKTLVRASDAAGPAQLETADQEKPEPFDQQLAGLHKELLKKYGGGAFDFYTYVTLGGDVNKYYMWQQVDFDSEQPKFSHETYRGYLQVEVEDIPQAVRILAEVVQRKIDNGEIDPNEVSLKWLKTLIVTTDIDRENKRAKFGEYASIDKGDPRIVIYHRDLDVIKSVLKTISEDPRWQSIEDRHLQISGSRREGTSSFRVSESDPEWRSLGYNESSGHSLDGIDDWRDHVKGANTQLLYGIGKDVAQTSPESGMAVVLEEGGYAGLQESSRSDIQRFNEDGEKLRRKEGEMIYDAGHFTAQDRDVYHALWDFHGIRDLAEDIVNNPNWSSWLPDREHAKYVIGQIDKVNSAEIKPLIFAGYGKGFEDIVEERLQLLSVARAKIMKDWNIS